MTISTHTATIRGELRLRGGTGQAVDPAGVGGAERVLGHAGEVRGQALLERERAVGDPVGRELASGLLHDGDQDVRPAAREVVVEQVARHVDRGGDVLEREVREPLSGDDGHRRIDQLPASGGAVETARRAGGAGHGGEP
ncbi:MAG TPA: hypothetical protein VNR66_00040 [Solirubrobacteraceae bacterium]|nr:hypothetical protein [Solirubrobacteraceae bacterium]